MLVLSGSFKQDRGVYYECKSLKGAHRKHHFMPQKSARFSQNAIKAPLTDHSIGTNLTRPAEITGIVLDYAI